MSKVLNTRIQYKYDSETNWNSSSFISLPGELYVYSPDSTHNYSRLKVGDGVCTVSDLPFTEVGEVEASIDSTPELISVFLPECGESEYTGNEITPLWVDPVSGEYVYWTEHSYQDKLSISGETSGTNAGTYTVYFTPNEGYCWEDETTDTKSVEWCIKPYSFKSGDIVVYNTETLNVIDSNSNEYLNASESCVYKVTHPAFVSFNDFNILLSGRGLCNVSNVIKSENEICFTIQHIATDITEDTDDYIEIYIDEEIGKHFSYNGGFTITLKPCTHEYRTVIDEHYHDPCTGYTIEECTFCGQTEEYSFDYHNWMEEGTTDDGENITSRDYYCPNCGETYTEYY